MMPLLIVFGIILLLALLLDTTDEDKDALWPLGKWSASIMLMLAIGVCIYALCQYL